MFVMPIISFLIGGLFMNGDISSATARGYKIMTVIDIAAYIAAWLLAVISRALYKNKFSLVLMIIYGCMLALGVVGFILLIAIFVGAF